MSNIMINYLSIDFSNELNKRIKIDSGTFKTPQVVDK